MRGFRITATSLIVTSWAVAVGAQPGAAATFTVTTTNDVVNAVDGVVSLREAFIAANANGLDDTIELEAGATYELTDCGAGVLEHTEDRALTIEAGGATIRQTCPAERVLASTDGNSTFTVNDAVIEGVPNPGGGILGAGIFTDGRLIVTGSTITSVDAGLGGSVVDGGMSGPLFTVRLIDTVITDNIGHGLRLSFGSVELIDTTITDNSADGVTLIDGSPVVVTDSVISGNVGRGLSTTGQGTTELTVTGSTIDGNGNTGVSCSACGRFTMDDSTVSNNGALAVMGGGGGISFTVDQDDPTDDPTVDIDGSSITGNSARRSGGGLVVGIIESSEPTAPSAIISLSDTEVRDNTTIGDAVPGGGIAVLTGSLALSTVEITGNTAGQGSLATSSHGGGVYFRESAGDGIADPHDLLFGGVLLADNTANGRGGGIEMATDGRLEATQVRLVDNTAATLGGGAFASTTVDVVDFVATGNSAVDGGGMYLSGGSSSTVSLRRGTVAANAASGRGGGVFVDHPQSVDLTNVTVHGNGAPRGGGFMLGTDPMSEGAPTTLDHVTLTANVAAVGANVAIDVGELVVGRSIVAEPAGGGTNCDSSGSVTSQGRSFLSDASCGSVPTDVISGASALLGTLADNGGFSQTRLPGAGSPVLGMVPVAECDLTDDQRGGARPLGPACEAGSVEVDEGSGGPAPIVGTERPDTLVGTNGDDVIQGLGGGDLLRGRGGDDVLDGGRGNDTLFGERGDDELVGGAGNDLLVGGPGTDVLRGGAGNDVLIASDSNDVLIGGPGRDRCFFAGSFLPRDC